MGKYIFDAIITPEDDGSYSVELPTLPGCFTCGDDYGDAVAMAADAARTWVASKLKHGEVVPPYRKEAAPEGSERLCVFFEVDGSYIVDGPVISAAQAARELGVSRGRVTHMIDAGLLDAYRSGRRTWVSEASVEARKENPRRAGRPRKGALQA